VPVRLGLVGYLAPLAVIAASYALFQAANNTIIMTNIRDEHRGAVSGLLSLSRTLGLINGASLMGAIFAFATGNIQNATAEFVGIGMRTAFAVAAVCILFAIAIARYARRVELV
jgi:MFS family permease